MWLRDSVISQRENPWNRSQITPSVFNCERPMRIYNKYIGEWVHVPCRKCRCCLSAIAQIKAAALVRDTQNYKYNFFVTLTFDKEHLPLAHLRGFHRDDDGNWFCEFQKSSFDCLKRKRVYSDVFYAHPIAFSSFKEPLNSVFPDSFSVADVSGFQKFIKRLRKRISKLPGYDKETYKIRYSFVNEFGPHTLRAHLHGILSTDCAKLASALPLLVRSCWSCYRKVSHGRYERNGFCSPRRLTIKRISGDDAQKYVCKYIAGSYGLPSLLNAKPFRSFFCSSRLPALGLKKGDFERCKVVFNTCCVVERFYDDKKKDFVERLIPDVLFRQFFRKCYRYSSSSISDRERILHAYRSFEKADKKIDFANLISRLPVGYSDSVFNDTNKLYYRCYLMWKSVFPSLTISEYVRKLDMIYSNRALYSLRSFYEKQEYVSQHVSDPACLLDFYPESKANIPEYCSYREWLYLEKKYNFSSFGLYFYNLYYIDKFDVLHSVPCNQPWKILTPSQEKEVSYHIKSDFFSCLNLDSWSDSHSRSIHTIMNNYEKRKKYNDASRMWDYV